MRFVQILLTTEQAELAAAACRDAEADLVASEGPGTPAAEDAKLIGRLGMLLQDAAENPVKYTPTGRGAATVRSIVRRASGPARPKPLNKRKRRQEERQRTSKERRKFRKVIADSYNEARTRMEAEKAEAEAAQAAFEERIAKQERYSVVNADGETLVGGVPAEFIVNDADGTNLLPKVIVP